MKGAAHPMSMNWSSIVLGIHELTELIFTVSTYPLCGVGVFAAQWFAGPTTLLFFTSIHAIIIYVKIPVV